MSEANATPAATGDRLVSLDVLRGFDMIWILGADEVVRSLARVTGTPLMRGLAAQMEHEYWAGFTAYDLIFPLFLFISGVAMVFSVPKLMERHGRAGAVRRILVRVALLVAFGIYRSGGFSHAWPDVRLSGVLQRISLAYGAAAMLFCFCRPRTGYIVSVALLVGYWALLAFVPIRDITLTPEAMSAALGKAHPTEAEVRRLYDSTNTFVTGRYDRGLNLANHLDFLWLPGWKYRTYWDPEGLLSMLPAVATCMMGVMAGRRLRRADRTPTRKALWLAAAGIVSLAAGWIWGLEFPVVKNIWSSSFVLVAGGWSLLLLAAFYYVVDVRQWRGWCRPFVWVGLNSITLYMALELIDFRGLAKRLVGGSVAAWLDARAGGLGNLGVALVGLGLMLALARFLHSRKIYLRV